MGINFDDSIAMLACIYCTLIKLYFVFIKYLCHHRICIVFISNISCKDILQHTKGAGEDVQK